jgi:hypothetical protein
LLLHRQDHPGLRNSALVCCLAIPADGARCGQTRQCAGKPCAGCLGGPVRRPGGQQHVGWWHVGWWPPGSAGPSGTGCIVTAEEVIGVASVRDGQAGRLHRRRSYARIAEHLGYPDRRAAHRACCVPSPSPRPRRRSCRRCGRGRPTSGYSMCSGVFNSVWRWRILSPSGDLVDAHLLSASSFGENRKS